MSLIELDLPRLDLAKIEESNNRNNHSYTLRSLPTQRKTIGYAINNEYIELQLLYDKNAYLYYCPRIPRAKTLGPLVSIFERFANWANPKFQVLGLVTFEKINKANSTMNVSETFVFCEQFGLFDNNYISKPEIMAIFAMTVCADTEKDSKYVSEIQSEIMKDFNKHKSRNSRDLTEQKFPFFLCRVAIIIFSKKHCEFDYRSLSTIEKVLKFISFFKFNDNKYVKKVISNAKSNKSRKLSNAKFLIKKTGLTNSGAMGLQKITKHIKDILYDVDIATAVKPLINLMLSQTKRDWIPFINNHLNISNIYISNRIDILKNYAFKIQITNKHPLKSITFNIDPLKLPKYLKFKYKNKILSPGMKCIIFIQFVKDYLMIARFNARKLRSYLVIDIIEKHHYNVLNSDTRNKSKRDLKQQTILQQINIPITTCFQFIKYKSTQDIFLSEQLCTPRDYPV